MPHIKSHIEKEALVYALCAAYSLLFHRDSSDFFLNLVGEKSEMSECITEDAQILVTSPSSSVKHMKCQQLH